MNSTSTLMENSLFASTKSYLKSSENLFCVLRIRLKTDCANQTPKTLY